MAGAERTADQAFLARIDDVGVEVLLEGDTLRLRNRREIALLQRKAFDVAIRLGELTELRLVQRPAGTGILGALLTSGLLLYGAGLTTFLWMSFMPVTMLGAAWVFPSIRLYVGGPGVQSVLDVSRLARKRARALVAQVHASRPELAQRATLASLAR